jgi:transposase
LNGEKRVSKQAPFTEEAKRQAVERMRTEKNISALARELGISRPVLYKWHDQLTGRQKPKTRPENSVVALRAEVVRLKTALADKVLEVEFFKGALQKIEEQRRSSSGTGVKASTNKSAN